MFFMPVLPNNPTVKDFQTYVVELEQERGFTNQTPVEKCLLLGEEVGELFKAVRKHGTTLKTDNASHIGTIEEELADILIYLCAIANRYDVDLETAFREKEEINKKRVWQ
jgi:NTP pyrophosphatase (non-canonical NTP hydrolase)